VPSRRLRITCSRAEHAAVAEEPGRDRDREIVRTHVDTVCADCECDVDPVVDDAADTALRTRLRDARRERVQLAVWEPLGPELDHRCTGFERCVHDGERVSARPGIGDHVEASETHAGSYLG
jgi:hypothetical protein